MKNIHLLPTEKASRIRLGNNKNFVIANFEQSSIRSKNDSYTNQHIYITFDEEIKVGEYVIDLENNEVFISLGKIGVNNYIKKIILTTDQDLIADGVQAIDDEFLEWFVLNPSCDEVEVKKVKQRCHLSLRDWVDEDENGDFPMSIAGAFSYRRIYKTIIPTEEQIN